ncbi:MAG: SH3 domain-containing protein [Cyanobacteria bacterium P01_D01_bin.115]
MDFLATPLLWELYETPIPTAQHKRAVARVRQLISPGRTVLLGAIALLTVSPALQANIFPPAGTAYIDPPPGYSLNIRSGPGTQYAAVNTLRTNSPITLTGAYQNGWAQLTDGTWVAGNLINSQPVIANSATTAYIAPPDGFNVNIRSGPGVQYAAVNTLPVGTLITITGRYEQGWAQLTDGNWVASNLIRIGAPINQPVPAPPLTPPVPPPDPLLLQVGTRNLAVFDLERRLLDLAYVTPNFVPDEYFGTDTEQAVKNFQQLNGLPADGVAGPDTRSLLYSDRAIPNTASGGSPTPPPPTNSDPPTEPNPPIEPNPPTEPTPPPDLGNSREVQISTADGLDALAFSGPGTEFDLVGFVPSGTTVTITGRTENRWSEVDDGSWIYNDFLDL